MLKDITERMSFSKMSLYLQCPHKWKLQYIKKIDLKKQSIQLLYGTAMHEVIQQFLKKYYSEYTLSFIRQSKNELLVEYSNLMVQRLMLNLQQKQKQDPTLEISEDLILTNLQFAVDTLTQFIPNCNKYFPKQHTELVGTEVYLKYQLQNVGIPFVGYIDVLIKDTKTGNYVIYDLKTSRTGWKDKQKKDEVKRLQLLLYKHFLSKQLQIPLQSISVQFLILKKTVYQKSEFKISRLQKFVPPSSTGTVKKAVKWFNDTLLQLQELCNTPDGQAQKNVTSLCNYCPYKKKIIEGQLLCDLKRKLPGK